MKLNKVFWPLMAVALTLGFTSCSKSDDNTDNAYQFNPPANPGMAMKLTMEFPDELLLGQKRVESVEFTEGTSVLIKQCVREAVTNTRAEGDEPATTIKTIYTVGDYVKANDVYSITVGHRSWGNITLQQESGNKATIIINAVGEPTQTSKATVETAATSSSTQPIDDLLTRRTWTPLFTRLNLQKQGTTGVVADELEGADFEAIKKRIEQEGCKIKDEFGDGYVVNSVFLSELGTFAIDFTNGKNYIGKWTWGTKTDYSADLRYVWEEENMGCEYENGSAHVDIYTTDVYQGECWLRLQSTIKQDDGVTWNCELIFRLIEKK